MVQVQVFNSPFRKRRIEVMYGTGCLVPLVPSYGPFNNSYFQHSKKGVFTLIQPAQKSAAWTPQKYP